MSDAEMRPLRADARRNRDRLLEVGLRAFSHGGPEATLEAIAAEAGRNMSTSLGPPFQCRFSFRLSKLSDCLPLLTTWHSISRGVIC
jgi:hypothetical protein